MESGSRWFRWVWRNHFSRLARAFRLHPICEICVICGSYLRLQLRLTPGNSKSLGASEFNNDRSMVWASAFFSRRGGRDSSVRAGDLPFQLLFRWVWRNHFSRVAPVFHLHPIFEICEICGYYPRLRLRLPLGKRNVTHDDDGNLTGNMRWVCSWDAEECSFQISPLIAANIAENQVSNDANGLQHGHKWGILAQSAAWRTE
jgi:hypothetical protein